MKNDSPTFKFTKEKIKKIFAEKLEKFSLKANLDLEFIERRPIEDENVYGEAFPEEKRVRLEVFAPDATDEEIEWNICHELVHIKYPELSHDDPQFDEKVNRHFSGKPQQGEAKK